MGTKIDHTPVTLEGAICPIHRRTVTLQKNSSGSYYCCTLCKDKRTFDNVFPHSLGNRPSYWDDPDDFPYGRDYEGGFYGD